MKVRIVDATFLTEMADGRIGQAGYDHRDSSIEFQGIYHGKGNADFTGASLMDPDDKVRCAEQCKKGWEHVRKLTYKE
jgi:hypothetical protein